MKKSIAIILSIMLVLAITLPTAAISTIAVKSIKLSSSKIALKAGQTSNLTVTFTPANTSQKKLTYVIGNKRIATVDAAGKITGVSRGVTTITVYTPNKKVFAKGSVTVSLVTLTMAIAQRHPEVSIKDNPLWKYAEAKTGIHIEFTEYPEAQYNTIMKTRAASRTNLPDMMNPLDDPYKDLQDGLIIDLKDLIKKDAPNMVKYMARLPEYKGAQYAPDGSVPVIKGSLEGYANTEPETFSIRKGWLDKLNLAEPTTIDEWYNVLKAFKEKDPNGNGLQDEIPMSLPGIYYYVNFANAWDYRADIWSGGWGADGNGKVQYYPIYPKLKEALVFINKLYKEGLLDPEFITQSYDTYIKKIANDKVGSTIFYGPEGINMTLKDSKINDLYVRPVPPKGPYGDQLMVGEGLAGGYQICITSSCKNPEIAMKWLDTICFTDEFIRLWAWGIKGTSYVEKDGSLVPINSPEAEKILMKWVQPALPYVYGKYEFTEKYKSWIPKGFLSSTELARMKENNKYIVPAYPPAYATSDESEIVNLIMPDIYTYTSEMISKFILGTESLDNWDKYVEKVKSMKVDKAIAIKQRVYDRFIKSSK